MVVPFVAMADHSVRSAQGVCKPQRSSIILRNFVALFRSVMQNSRVMIRH